MKIEAGHIYHIYNRGNNRQRIFFKPDNYIFFIKKMRLLLHPHCHFLAYCLMPNHFHFLIYATEQTIAPFQRSKSQKAIKMSVFAHGMKQLLSGYAKAINKQEGRTGSLFRQNTKCIQTSGDNFEEGYSLQCFYYIHLNPVKARLVAEASMWAYSSSPDYRGLRQGTLCDQKMAIQLLGLSPSRLKKRALGQIDLDWEPESDEPW